VTATAAARPSPTLDEVRGWPATIDVREACRAIGISPAWGYELAKRGDFPCRLIRIAGGRRVRVATASLVSLIETGQP
jgi:predicted DNA-binding transcriptional regulator AlpA